MKKIVKACMLLLCALFCSGQTQFSVDVTLVHVGCTVTDRHGALVHDLKREDFVLKEDGHAQPIKYLWQSSDLPLRIGIIVDVSTSQAELRMTHWARVSRFIQRVLGPADRGFIATIGPQDRVLTGWDATSYDLLHAVSPVELQGRVESSELLGGKCEAAEGGDYPCGGTALWHGLYYASWLGMRNAEGRKALVVISDGWDTGSDKNLKDVIWAAEETDTLIYSIHYVSDWARGRARKEYIQNNILTGAGDLERLSRDTGGRRFEGSDENLDLIFAKIEDELRTEYVLAYAPPSNTRKKKFHKISVKTIKPDLDVRARAGYHSW